LIKFVRPVLGFLLNLGYFGPALMGVLDSSFLFLPFGNDLLVITLVARNHPGWPGYVLTAAIGSTIGVLVLALVANKLGEEGNTENKPRLTPANLRKHSSRPRTCPSSSRNPWRVGVSRSRNQADALTPRGIDIFFSNLVGVAAQNLTRTEMVFLFIDRSWLFKSHRVFCNSFDTGR
jgi:hypothetical protein